MNNQIIEVTISEIKISTRFRKMMGDIEGLAQSIKETDLLHPIGITPDFELIFGERRLCAYRDVLGRKTIPARFVDVHSILHCQFAENTMRKDYTPSELVSIVEAIASFSHGGDRKSDQALNSSVETLTIPEATRRIGWSKDTFNRAKTVRDKGVPELVEAMDNGELKISAASELAKCEPDEQKSVLKKGADHAKWFVSRIRQKTNEKSTPGYSTPQWLFEHLDQEFHFTLDAAALPENAKCDRFFTPATDGLCQSWAGEVVWCNPPFSTKEIGAWVKKAFDESKKGATTVMLLPSGYKDYKWWKVFCIHGRVRFIHDYVRFPRCDDKEKSAYVDVTVVIFGPNIAPGSAGPPIIKAMVETASTAEVSHMASDQPPAALANTPESAVLTSFC